MSCDPRQLSLSVSIRLNERSCLKKQQRRQQRMESSQVRYLISTSDIHVHVCVYTRVCTTSTKSLTLSGPLVFLHIDCSFKHTLLPRAPIFLLLCSPEDLLGNLGTGCLATKVKVFDEYNLGGGGGREEAGTLWELMPQEPAFILRLWTQ